MHNYELKIIRELIETYETKERVERGLDPINENQLWQRENFREEFSNDFEEVIQNEFKANSSWDFRGARASEEVQLGGYNYDFLGEMFLLVLEKNDSEFRTSGKVLWCSLPIHIVIAAPSLVNLI